MQLPISKEILAIITVAATSLLCILCLAACCWYFCRVSRRRGRGRQSSKYEIEQMGLPWIPATGTNRVCAICATPFRPWRRAHHCRQCGSVVCDECSQGRLLMRCRRGFAVDGIDKKSVRRACDMCLKKRHGTVMRHHTTSASIEAKIQLPPTPPSSMTEEEAVALQKLRRMDEPEEVVIELASGLTEQAWSIPFQALTWSKLDKIGGGGGGNVYRAKFARTDVALKELFVMMMNTKDTAEFQKEAAALASLHHPKIPQFFGIAMRPSDSLLFLVNEYVPHCLEALVLHLNSEGKARFNAWGVRLVDSSTGKAKKKCRPITRRHVLQMMRDVAEAMAFLRSKKVVHRDIKPQNILFDAWPNCGSAKLCDFGLARTYDYASGDQMTSDVGTPQYMAPESFDSESEDEEEEHARNLANGAKDSPGPRVSERLKALLGRRSSPPPPEEEEEEEEAKRNSEGRAGPTGTRDAAAGGSGGGGNDGEGEGDGDGEGAETKALLRAAARAVRGYKCDMYSFGVTLWAGLEFLQPWAGVPTTLDITRTVMSGGRPLFSPDAKWPPRLRALVESCWHHTPEERPTFDVVAEELDALSESKAVFLDYSPFVHREWNWKNKWSEKLRGAGADADADADANTTRKKARSRAKSRQRRREEGQHHGGSKVSRTASTSATNNPALAAARKSPHPTAKKARGVKFKTWTGERAESDQDGLIIDAEQKVKMQSRAYAGTTG